MCAATATHANNGRQSEGRGTKEGTFSLVLSFPPKALHSSKSSCFSISRCLALLTRFFTSSCKRALSSVSARIYHTTAEKKRCAWAPMAMAGRERVVRCVKGQPASPRITHLARRGCVLRLRLASQRGLQLLHPRPQRRLLVAQPVFLRDGVGQLFQPFLELPLERLRDLLRFLQIARDELFQPGFFCFQRDDPQRLFLQFLGETDREVGFGVFPALLLGLHLALQLVGTGVGGVQLGSQLLPWRTVRGFSTRRITTGEGQTLDKIGSCGDSRQREGDLGA